MTSTPTYDCSGGNDHVDQYDCSDSDNGHTYKDNDKRFFLPVDRERQRANFESKNWANGQKEKKKEEKSC